MTQETVEQQDASIVEQQAQDTAQSEDTSVEVSESEADTDLIEQDDDDDDDEQDDKATALELAEWALEELSGELVDKLFGELNVLNEPKAQEAKEQAAKARTLRESHESLQHRVAAQQRVLAAEMDRAIAEGRDADAEARRQESVGLGQNLRDIQTQASACDRRVQELEAEQKRNYLTILRAPKSARAPPPSR